MWIFLLLLLILGIIPIIYLSGNGKKWREFYITGTDAGFSVSEIRMLKKAAEQANLETPSSIFFSIDQLDHSISVLSKIVDSNGVEYTPEESELLKKLFAYRKTIELNKPRYKSGLKHTKELKEGQIVKIALGKIGLFNSEVVEVDDKYLTVAYPTGNTLPTGVSWRGKKLRVYFQKFNDASYYFETIVKDDYFDRSFKLLHIAHSSSILRSQRRKSVRTQAEFPIKLFLLKDLNQVDNLLLSEGGFNGEMQDISEDGCSLLIGGKGKDGLLLKLQFQLSNSILVICGVVRFFEYKEDDDKSNLHIQFMKPDDVTRNKILSYVYDVHRSSQLDKKEDNIQVELDSNEDLHGDDEAEEVELLESFEDEEEDDPTDESNDLEKE